jgi:hypothetical protein
MSLSRKYEPPRPGVNDGGHALKQKLFLPLLQLLLKLSSLSLFFFFSVVLIVHAHGVFFTRPTDYCFLAPAAIFSLSFILFFLRGGAKKPFPTVGLFTFRPLFKLKQRQIWTDNSSGHCHTVAKEVLPPWRNTLNQHFFIYLLG